MSDVTQLLSAIDRGDRQAAGELLPLVYDELRKLAAHKIAQEQPGQTLQPTALVHDARLRLVGDESARFEGRGHFAHGVPPLGGRAGRQSGVVEQHPTEPPEGGTPCRRAPTKELIAQLRGDLDWIVLEALEKDRARRYETANALDADLQRHLNHEPVLARPPNPLYLFGKTVRRNRSAFTIAAAVTKFSYVKLSSTVSGALNEATSNAKPTTGDLFSYDPKTKQHYFNWGTKGLTSGTYVLQIKLGDGVSRTVKVGLK